MPLAVLSLTQLLVPRDVPHTAVSVQRGGLEWAEVFRGQEVMWQDPQPTQLCRESGMRPSFPYSNTVPATSPGNEFLLRAVPFAQERSSYSLPTSG